MTFPLENNKMRTKALRRLEVDNLTCKGRWKAKHKGLVTCEERVEWGEGGPGLWTGCKGGRG